LARWLKVLLDVALGLAEAGIICVVVLWGVGYKLLGMDSAYFFTQEVILGFLIIGLTVVGLWMITEWWQQLLNR